MHLPLPGRTLHPEHAVFCFLRPVSAGYPGFGSLYGSSGDLPDGTRLPDRRKTGGKCRRWYADNGMARVPWMGSRGGVRVYGIFININSFLNYYQQFPMTYVIFICTASASRATSSICN